MSNIELFYINCTYQEKRKILIANKTIDLIKSQSYPARLCIFNNLCKRQLKQSLKTATHNKKSFTNTAIIFIHGHGGFNFDDQKEIFMTEEGEYIYLDDIAVYFGSYENVVIILDACQQSKYTSDQYHHNINILKTNIILCCAVPKCHDAYGSKKGMLFTKSVCSTLQINIKPTETIKLETLMEYIYLAYKGYFTKYGIIPKIYTNDYGMNDLLAMFKNITHQNMFLLRDRNYQATHKYDDIYAKKLKSRIYDVEYNDKN